MRISINLLILVSFVFLFSCTPTEPNIINGTEEKEEPEQIEEEFVLEDDVVIFDIHRFSARDVSVFMFFQDGALNVINCGDIVYGSVMADEISRLTKDSKEDVILRITNSSIEYIRGCEEIVTEFNIREIHLYVNETEDTIAITRWLPAFDRYFHEEEYILVYKNTVVDLSKITLDGLYINGTELIYR